MIKIAVLDYGIGNLRSAEKALQHVGAAAHLVTDPAQVESADAVVLPGVGAFGACARALGESGLEPAARAALESGVPFFGVCIGFQLLYAGSEENPGVAGLGVFPGTVALLAAGEKHPQMQWNQLTPCRGLADGPVDARADGGAHGDAQGGNGAGPVGPLRGLGEKPWVYFVHSYAPPIGPETVAVCDYGGPVAAVVVRDNVWGAQFHPEKSGRSGLAMLANFVALAA